jgi:hypothetical protein
MTTTLTRLELLREISGRGPKRTFTYRNRTLITRHSDAMGVALEVVASPDLPMKVKNNPAARLQAIRDIDYLIDLIETSTPAPREFFADL